jgi:hypothetical protein
VAGAGQLHPQTLTDLEFAKVLGVRGALTRRRIQCGSQSPTIGDPALLVPELVTPTPNTIEVGVVPHWSDNQLFDKEYVNAAKYGYALPTLIDPTDDPLVVATKIGSCRKIVTSSLHGVIAADAFGIPRRAELAPSMVSDAIHEGGAYKWQDYGSSIAQQIVFGSLQFAPKVRVDQMQYDLFEMFQKLRGM